MFLDFHAKDRERLAAPPEEFLGKHMKEVLPPEVADGLLLCFDRGDALRRHRHARGPRFPVMGEVRFFEARVVRCDADKVLAIVRDITERRRAERKRANCATSSRTSAA